MAEYVKGLGEILAGQREEIHGPQDEIDAIMGKAGDKLAAMNRLAKKQNRMAQRKINEDDDDDDQDDEPSNNYSKGTTRKTAKKSGGGEDNLPNPDDLMSMLMAQNGNGRMPNQGGMMMPGGFPMGMPGGMMPMPGMGPMGGPMAMPGTSMHGSVNKVGSKR